MCHHSSCRRRTKSTVDIWMLTHQSSSDTEKKTAIFTGQTLAKHGLLVKTEWPGTWDKPWRGTSWPTWWTSSSAQHPAGLQATRTHSQNSVLSRKTHSIKRDARNTNSHLETGAIQRGPQSHHLEIFTENSFKNISRWFVDLRRLLNKAAIPATCYMWPHQTWLLNYWLLNVANRQQQTMCPLIKSEGGLQSLSEAKTTHATG